MGRIAERPVKSQPSVHSTSRSDEFANNAGSSDATLEKQYFSTLPLNPLFDTAYTAASSTATASMTPSDLSASDCCTCAFRAVRVGHFGCLKRVPKSDLLQVDVEKRSMLHLAVKYGHVEIVDYLLAEAPALADFESNLNETPLLIAAAIGRADLMERLLRGPLKTYLQRALHRDVNGTSCLMACVARNDNDIALWLLRRFGRQLAMLPNNCQMLPIHIAAANGNLEFLRIVTKYDQRMVNYRDQFGCTPCTYAAQGGSLNCLRYLIEKARADISALTNKGQSLLHVASLSGHVAVVRWFLCRTESDAVLWPTYDRGNAIHCAAFGGHVEVAKLLLELWPKKRRRTILAMSDARGNTPLHLAAINNQLPMVKYLLDLGANPKQMNAAGQSAEQIAQRRGFSSVAQYILISLTGKKLKNGKKFSRSCTDLLAASAASHSIAVANDMYRGGAVYADHTLPIHSHSETLDTSSGFLSEDSGAERELLRAPQRSEMSTQTDPSHFSKSQVLCCNNDEWHGEALAAVEEIDKVLDALGN